MKESQILHPITHTNTRTEWFFPKKSFEGRIRLVNVGYVTTAANDPYYNALGGVNTIIKSIYLYDNGEEISGVREFDMWGTFKNLKGVNNSYNGSKNSVLHNNNWGFDVNGTDYVTRIYTEPAKASPDDGFLYLDEYLDFLKQIKVLDNQYRNLSLVVEWNWATDLRPYLGKTAVAAITGSVNRPYLIIDVLPDEKPQDRMAVFDEIVSEKIAVPAINPAVSTTQNVSGRVNSVNGNYVKNLYYFNRPAVGNDNFATDEGMVLRTYSSKAMFNEKMMFQVNGSQHIPQLGINSIARKMAYLTDAADDCNVCIYGYNVDIADAPRRVITQDGGLVNLTLGYLSFGCIKVNQFCNEIDYEYSRDDSGADNDARKTFTLQIYTEQRRTAKMFMNGVTDISKGVAL